MSALDRLSRHSKGLARGSKGLAKTSTALDKKSIVSIAKNSTLGSASADGHVSVNIEADEVPWHAITDAEEVVQELASNSTDGLSIKEAERRLNDFGPNALTPPAKPGFLKRLWHHLNNVLIFVLFAAAVIKGALQSWPEFGLVLLVIIINTAIGMLQEGKAEKAAEAIKAMLSPNALVIRAGEQQTIPADELVPGDIVLLKSGDKVPADLRLITCTNLQVQEAMLTGESVPVSKVLSPAPAAASLGDRKCMCYSATAVTSGQARAVVVATGDSAEIGQINKMVNTVDNVRNNLVHQLEILGRWLSVMVLIVGVITLLLAVYRGGNSFRLAFASAVSVAVAIIPEGLPAMVTVVLAIGTTVMAKNNAIIRQLPAVETLGSLDVICSDKTGTLTKNEMTVVSIRTAERLYTVSGVGYAPKGGFSIEGKTSRLAASGDVAADGADASAAPAAAAANACSANELHALQALLEGATLCNDSVLSKSNEDGKESYTPLGAPTEVALLTVCEKAGINQKQLKAAKPRVASVPFESEHKFMATVHEQGPPIAAAASAAAAAAQQRKRIIFVKGAPDRLLPLCKSQVAGDDVSMPAAPLDLGFWQEQQAQLSSKGLRVLALCRAELPADEDLTGLNAATNLSRGRFLSMVMLLAILDPPREEAVTAIKVAHRAGIQVKMITGDHALTALAIGGMLGIAGSGQVFTGPEIDRIDDGALRAIVLSCNVYARASPENKLRIVRALQELKKTVAMTGDGVNDAPALKAADVGVAMGITGTDVSKEAAKMVLADDNFASIVAAVKEGRRVWDNIRKILVFNLPVNLAQGLSVLYSYILGSPNPPLTALQVLLVNLVTSVTLGLALAAEPAEPDVMDRPPRRPNKRLVGKLLLWRCFFVCHLVVVLVLGMFEWALTTRLSLGQARAEAFNVLVGAQVVYFITCRFLKASTFHPRVFRGNKVAYASVLTTLLLMVFLTFTPGVNRFFAMEALLGVQVARVAVCMVVIYAVVEVEKALVDPVLMPMIRPVLSFLENITPRWLTVEHSKPLFTKCMQAPRTKSFRAQMRGKSRNPKPASIADDSKGAAAAAAEPGQLPQLTELAAVHHD
uniref:Cation-transporting P-type ATPase N-terminal domain-containing protein n=1 Tax=Tetradesmus obliquus TaxID=3088 RepID=A0A383V2S6_TETOB|eukprot:jgi/Sobl393_1/12328/SZX59887.1